MKHLLLSALVLGFSAFASAEPHLTESGHYLSYEIGAAPSQYKYQEAYFCYSSWGFFFVRPSINWCPGVTEASTRAAAKDFQHGRMMLNYQRHPDLKRFGPYKKELREDLRTVTCFWGVIGTGHAELSEGR